MACPKEEGGLGFRDFQMFNMAIVAKQGWNFINNPSSLVARIFKARHFPRSSLLDSNLGNNPSFTWRSIWKSRQVLLYGCRWCIGDGSNIKVMGEPWSRVDDGRWVTSPQTQGVYNLSIQQLMIPNAKHWDVEKINSLFSENEAKKILAVPLLHMIEVNKLIWSDESDGIYSVRSGYRRLMKERRMETRPREEEAWGTLWKIQAPPKAKHLLWRICKECLPTRTRLRNKYVQCPVKCSLCSMEPEEECHLFLECEGNKEAWNCMRLNHVIQSRKDKFHNISALLFDVCRNETKQVVGKMATLLWCMWQNRNNNVWNTSKLNAQQVGMQAAHMWNDWAAVQSIIGEHQTHVQHLQSGRTADQWQYPRFGYVKCNVDASFYDAAEATGFGWCVRDHNGRFVLAGTNIMQARLNTLEGEAMAIKEAIGEMLQRGFSHVIFESDSKIVVDAISSSHLGISEFSLLISNIK